MIFSPINLRRIKYLAHLLIFIEDVSRSTKFASPHEKSCVDGTRKRCNRKDGTETRLFFHHSLQASSFFVILFSSRLLAYKYIGIVDFAWNEGIKAFARQSTLLVSCCIGFVHLYKREIKKIKMRPSTLLAIFAMLVSVVWSYPQKDGQVFSNEAIRQAQNTYLIPKDATIQKVQEGIELAAYESIPGDERINLFEILGDQVPPEVVSNLQGQIDQIGRS